MAITDADDAYLAYSDAFGTATIGYPAGVITIRSVEASDYSLIASPSYAFQLYMSTTVSTSSEIKIAFPSEFDLGIKSSLEWFVCSSTYTDEVSNSEHAWNSNESCDKQGDSVVLEGDTLTTDFQPTDLVAVTL